MNVLHLQHRLPPQQDAFMQPTKPTEELYDLRRDPDELHNLAAEPTEQAVLEEMRAELRHTREAVGDSGVDEVFRHGGWPAQYPTRSLAEWQHIEEQWKKFVLGDGPFPAISNPPAFWQETPAGERPGK